MSSLSTIPHLTSTTSHLIVFQCLHFTAHLIFFFFRFKISKLLIFVVGYFFLQILDQISLLLSFFLLFKNVKIKVGVNWLWGEVACKALIFIGPKVKTGPERTFPRQKISPQGTYLEIRTKGNQGVSGNLSKLPKPRTPIQLNPLSWIRS